MQEETKSWRRRGRPRRVLALRSGRIHEIMEDMIMAGVSEEARQQTCERGAQQEGEQEEGHLLKAVRSRAVRRRRSWPTKRRGLSARVATNTPAPVAEKLVTTISEIFKFRGQTSIPIPLARVLLAACWQKQKIFRGAGGPFSDDHASERLGVPLAPRAAPRPPPALAHRARTGTS